MSHRTKRDYFDLAYNQDPQVFGQTEGWYERRKRNLLVATLPAGHYAEVFEPGCGIGALSSDLLDRCEHLLMMDWSRAALEHARVHLSGRVWLEIVEGAIPEDWPVGRQFDLIVISELLYYFTEEQIRECALLTFGSLRKLGDVVLMHWRHPSPDYPTTGPFAHQCFIDNWPIPAYIQVVHEEPDFVLTVLGNDHADR